jgi:hypothetical protein
MTRKILSPALALLLVLIHVACAPARIQAPLPNPRRRPPPPLCLRPPPNMRPVRIPAPPRAWAGPLSVEVTFTDDAITELR